MTTPHNRDLAGLLTLFGCSDGKPEDFARTFYAAVAAGRFEDVVNMFSLDGVPSDDRMAARGKITMIVSEMEARIKHHRR